MIKPLVLALCALALAPVAAHAQKFPDHPVRVVVPFPAGGTLDGPARILTAAMAKLSGQQFIVDNKAGAGGTVGAGEIARAAPDGYNLLITSSSIPISHVLYGKSAPFDAIKSYRHIGVFAVFPSVIAVNPARVQAKTLAELIAYAKANPGKLSYGSPGSGTASHFAGEMFKDQAGVDLLHVPYRGAAPALTDVLGGQIDMVVLGASSVGQHIKSGKLRALGVTTAERSPLVPDVPAIGETVKGYEFLSWVGLAAPAGTPEAALAALTQLVRRAMQDPSVQAQLTAGGVTGVFRDEKETNALLTKELAAFGAVVKKANIKPE